MRVLNATYRRKHFISVATKVLRECVRRHILQVLHHELGVRHGSLRNLDVYRLFIRAILFESLLSITAEFDNSLLPHDFDHVCRRSLEEQKI